MSKPWRTPQETMDALEFEENSYLLDRREGNVDPELLERELKRIEKMKERMRVEQAIYDAVGTSGIVALDTIGKVFERFMMSHDDFDTAELLTMAWAQLMGSEFAVIMGYDKLKTREEKVY